MPDPRFYDATGPISIAEAIALTGSTLLNGEPTKSLTHVTSIECASDPTAVVYCDKVSLLKGNQQKQFGLLLTLSSEDLAGFSGALAISPLPKLAFALIANRLHKSRANASVDTPRTQRENTRIHSSAIIDESAEIGSGAIIGCNVYIGPGVVVGADCHLGAGTTITHSIIGGGVRILPGARIGQAGFGFVATPDGLIRMPQLGRVLIGDDVEIGANTTIDRGALEDTVIGKGTKIDNLVQIGHNARIGRNCVIAAQSGISGSCVLGDGVMLGGQVGLADHLTIGDGAQIAAGSGLMRDVPPNEKWGGRPGRPIKDWLREVSVLSKLAKKRNVRSNGES